jgi:hypothetical protein
MTAGYTGAHKTGAAGRVHAQTSAISQPTKVQPKKRLTRKIGKTFGCLRDFAMSVGRNSRARLKVIPTSVPRATNALSISGSSPCSWQVKVPSILA